MTLEDKLKKLYQLRVEKEKLEKLVGDYNKQIAELNEDVTDEFQSRQIQNIKLEDIGIFSLRVKVYPRATDKLALKTWLESQGYGWETVLAYNHNKFVGFYNELLDNKKSLPPCVEQFTKAIIAIPRPK